MTNWHVIKGGDAFGVCFRPKKGEEVCNEIHEGYLVNYNKKKDLALLYIQTDRQNLELIKKGESIVITGGVPVGISGTTNYLTVLTVSKSFLTLSYTRLHSLKRIIN